MNPNEHRKFRITPVTPVFIGDGNVFKPLSYVIEGNVVHVIRSETFFTQLSDVQRETYLKWIEPILEQLSYLDGKIEQAGRNYELRRRLQQQKRQKESELSIEQFIRNHLRANPTAIARSCLGYSVRFSSNPEGTSGFRTHIKDYQQNPYIPGTEIKGALRTSLLYALLNEPANYDFLANELSNFRRLFRSGESAGRKIEKFEEISGKLEYELLRGKKNDAKFDFFKLIQISDSTALSPSVLKIELTQTLGTHRYTKTWVETISPSPQSNCAFDLTIGNPDIVLRELGLEQKNLRGWLSMPKLLEACYLRSKDILSHEKDYFADEPPILNLISRLQQQNQPSSPLFRLGAGQGFLGTTVGLQVKERDEKLYDEAIREGVSFQRRWRTQQWDFPKTRRVITDSRDNPTNLLGWVKISNIQGN